MAYFMDECKSGIEVEKISGAFDFASEEATKCIQNHLMEKNDDTWSKSVLQNVIYTMLGSKLIAEDAKLFTQLVADVWSQFDNTRNVDTSVSLQCFAGQPTNESQILHGKQELSARNFDLSQLLFPKLLKCFERIPSPNKMLFVCFESNIKKSQFSKYC